MPEITRSLKEWGDLLTPSKRCFKCGKEMERADGNLTIRGLTVDITIEEPNRTQETIDHNNLQLGKYSDGNGECHVGICYECYIDGLFK